MGVDIKFEVSAIDGAILKIDRQIETVSGYTSHELIGRSMWNLYENMAIRDQLLTELTIHKQVTDYHVKFKNKDGSLVNFLLNARLEYNAGKPEKVVGSVKKYKV